MRQSMHWNAGSTVPKRRDYPVMIGAAAIVLGVSVILGIVFTYAGGHGLKAGDDISARINIFSIQQLPMDL